MNVELQSKIRGLRLEDGQNLVGNPYIVGRWVRGADHYDRKSLIEYLLDAQDTAFWVVGTRRMGKTSLLRQLEYLTDDEKSPYVPLFWDLQGCSTPQDLSGELYLAIEDVAERFARLDVDTTCLRDDDAANILRRLGRETMRHGRELLLLVDEAEVLIEIGQTESAWLARLRKAMQEGNLRAVIASTRLLTQLTDQSGSWMTSPFLFGFHMVNLWTLHREGAKALVRQAQSAQPVQADEALVEEILDYTNSHPYLVQYLCQRLFAPDAKDGRLRAVQEDDLEVDQMLASFFRLDFHRLSVTERRILLAVAEAGALDEDGIRARLADCADVRLISLLHALEELGHLRRCDEGWAAGSEFLLRWLQDNSRQLAEELRNEDTPAAGGNDGAADMEALARTLGISPERIQALAGQRITSDGEFFEVIKRFFYEIRYLVEQDDGHKLLVTTTADGAPVLRSEEDVQIALKHWLRPMCRALNIHMDREALTGRGFLDFKFSIGHDFRCLAEVKLFHSARLEDGIGIQLPTYMIADRARYGIYVPIFLDPSGYLEAVAKLEQLAGERAQSHGVEIGVVDIRAWKPAPASRAGEIEERNRYYPDGLAVRRSTETAGHGEPEQEKEA